MRTTFASVLAAAVLAASTNAFWGQGHILVSRQAESLLEVNAPAALDAAIAVLATLAKSNPTLIKDEKNHPFTECATFADDIKGEGYTFQSSWHFVDQPYLSDGGSIEDYPLFVASATNLLDAMTDLTALLKGEDMSSSVYVSQIASRFPSVEDQKSFALRLVVHYVGDIHQPLHAVAEVNKEYPKGDKGGNSEWIDPNIGGVGNLHSLWDSILYTYSGYETLPFNDADWTTYTTTAETEANLYPVDVSDLHAGDFQTWANESFEMAKEFVYPDFTEHVVPTDEYTQTRIPLLEARIVLAGARLAALIEDVYGDSSAFTQFTQ